MKVMRMGLFVLLITWAVVSSGENWPTWRGPQRNGISRETAWDPAALDPDAEIVWQKSVGWGHSSFAVRGGKLYTIGNIDDQDIIYCLDAKTGDDLWQYKYDCPKGNYGGPRSTPVLDGDNLYTLSRDGQVHCIDVANRKLKWKRNIVESEGIKIPTWGLASSAWIEGEMVLFNAGSAGIALDKKTGETVWCGDPQNSSYASPVVYDSGSKRCAAFFNGKEIVSVDVESGDLLWSFNWKTKYDVNAADPIVSDGKMFISSGYGTGCCLLDITGSEPEVLWRNDNMRNHFNSCVLLDGKLYGIDGNTGRGAVACLDFETGKEEWRHGKGYEGLMAADGKLIVMDSKGFLTIAEATPEAYREISSSQVLDRSAKNWTVPVLANGHIYCRNSKGDIVCVDVN